ncbi:hypothetical protein M2459_001590 [Parabacteroides sp. PF5-5]|uniref:hypothetical protein n=1 Tax=unclassified Parabacteroides TaxID=2649774 RepID=UPI0024748568|nr:MULTISPECIES: hypothetical protein [unclassified Parabacteroides]MDH6304852.1 hypothetical protein [Parabacteroides sp. PH5-39]MDH6316062.1 hypothetical protein [Parabacteroides sp. PF5-13]MDH6319719.1 hypothetical protein [Parabacteroides sp. PH5-13]MDH6323450.1 hypothetical protein [Parabacteroides sp. PH5-8]MDH6327042.1 hypothetical protein [Parabacteroides sp. PH5-41]
MRKLFVCCIALFVLMTVTQAKEYANFRVATYVMASQVNALKDQKALDSFWDGISKNITLDKIYLETFRDNVYADEATLQRAIKYFKGKGLIVGGGITYNAGGGTRMRWETFCYSNPEHRETVKKVAEYTAKYFDEFVLDDYYFTNCKCDLCIAAKGNKSWSKFRMDLLDESAKELIVNPALAVNPNTKVVVKYPNWYDHFQGLGFDLERGSHTFGGMYTGTETRSPLGEQHLQPYESFGIVRYLENIRPGHNLGGWVDTGSMDYLDMYPEQLWLTMLAKAPEITLWHVGSITAPINRAFEMRSWSDDKPTLDMQAVRKEGEARGSDRPTMGSVAAYSLKQVDKIVGKLGTPSGIKAYKPYNSLGDDFLHNYMGTAGIPIEIVPEFPEDSKLVLLTESAKYDPNIVEKMKRQMQKGGDVLITAELFRALSGKGIENIVEMEYTDRTSDVSEFIVDATSFMRRKVVKSDVPVRIPQMTYFTNDSWEDISTLDYGNGWPILQQIAYSNGNMYVWVMPHNFSHIYALPTPVLNRVRTIVSRDVDVRLEGPDHVMLLTYDNGTFVVMSVRDEPVTINVVTRKSNSLTELSEGTKIKGDQFQEPRMYGRNSEAVTRYQLIIQPHSFKGYKID